MAAYSVYLHLELLDVVPARGEQRRLIMSFIRWLAENPHAPGDLTDRDQSLRTARSKSLAAMRYLLGGRARQGSDGGQRTSGGQVS